MKKFFTILLFGCLGLSAALMNMSCNATSPSSANFESPLQTIVAINPSFTATPTFTFTPTSTHTCPPADTATFTPTGTLTPSLTPTVTSTGTLPPTLTPTSCP